MDPSSLHVTDISQEKTTEPDEHGGFQDVFKVHFTTPSGTRTHVKVPASHYTPKNVAAAIHHETRQIEEVHALEGIPLTPAVTE